MELLTGRNSRSRLLSKIAEVVVVNRMEREACDCTDGLIESVFAAASRVLESFSLLHPLAFVYLL